MYFSLGLVAWHNVVCVWLKSAWKRKRFEVAFALLSLPHLHNTPGEILMDIGSALSPAPLDPTFCRYACPTNSFRPPKQKLYSASFWLPLDPVYAFPSA